jgi:CTP:molybdopterin cytidylyltransferase MocA
MTGHVAAILLAAGRSRRMGSCKQLLDLGGKTVLARCIETLLSGGVEDVVVTVGAQGEAVRAEAQRFPVRIAVNDDIAGDMTSSVLVGRRALLPAVSGVIIALCDYPLVTSRTICRLASAHSAAPASILIPCHGEQRGHPTLFPADCLAELTKGCILRDLVRRDSGRVQMLAVDDPGILRDMDTPEQYLLVKNQFEASQTDRVVSIHQ